MISSTEIGSDVRGAIIENEGTFFKSFSRFAERGFRAR